MGLNSMKVVKVAYIVAFVMAGLAVISALTGQIVLLPLALIPLIAGLGILRKRVWSAYGFAFYLFAQLLLVVFALLHGGGRTMGLPGIIGGAALMGLLVPVFLFAGRSLAGTGAKRGRALPWIAVSALTTLPLLFVQAFVIPTGAMENTLLIGDCILTQRFPKPSPQRGDMIVFVNPIDRRQTLVKRIIGVPGDHIQILGKIVYRNGATLAEPYAVHKTDYLDSYRDNFPSEPNGPLREAALEMLRNHVENGEVVVPEGKYFVLGDNRDHSLDSRYWGFVGSDDLVGKPLLIYDSEDKAEQELLTGKSSRRIRWDRLLRVL